MERSSLTLYEKLSLLISFTGALSLVFIFIQTRQANASMELAEKTMKLSTETMELSKASMKSSMYEIMNGQTLEMDKIFLERPYLRPYFYENKNPAAIRDEKTRNEVMIVAEYQLDFFDMVMTQLDYIPTDKDSAVDKANWRKYFIDSFATSPALCHSLDENADWYMPRLKELSEAPCKKHR